MWWSHLHDRDRVNVQSKKSQEINGTPPPPTLHAWLLSVQEKCPIASKLHMICSTMSNLPHAPGCQSSILSTYVVKIIVTSPSLLYNSKHLREIMWVKQGNQNPYRFKNSNYKYPHKYTLFPHLQCRHLCGHPQLILRPWSRTLTPRSASTLPPTKKPEPVKVTVYSIPPP